MGEFFLLKKHLKFRRALHSGGGGTAIIGGRTTRLPADAAAVAVFATQK